MNKQAIANVSTRNRTRVILSLFVFSVFLSQAVHSQVHAADFGGDCCADLEERIAELEETTARKGNRKVSLAISGHVNEAVIFWDDGVEQNVYQVTGENSRTRVRFRGGADISDDLYAKYRLELGFRTSRLSRVTADNDDEPLLDLRYSEWTLGSRTFGQVTVGEAEDAAQNITHFNLGGHTHFARDDILDWNANFEIQTANGGTGIAWRRLMSGDSFGDGDRDNLVRYDTPTLAGFKLSAHWGEDDSWGVGLRYANEFADFKVAAGIAYREITEDEHGCTEITQTQTGLTANCQEFGTSASVRHVPSGLFVAAAYGYKLDKAKSTSTQTAVTNVDDDDERWYVSAGIYQKFNSLGKTSIFGEYGAYDNGTPFDGDDVRSASGNPIQSSEIEMWGVGINQKIDAAAMDIYLGYRHYTSDIVTTAGPVQGLKDHQAVLSGARIKF